jgi:glycosyltransferase involved in cell wall biosynthesis
MKGLFAWIGYPQTAVEYQREARRAGESKFSYWKLWNLALEGITSFSVGPLKVATYIGLCIAFSAFLFAGWIVLKTIMYGEPVRGYPTIMTTILLLGGMQLTAIGILGEYLGRVFNETKLRPLYFVNAFYSNRGDTGKVLTPPRPHVSGAWSKSTTQQASDDTEDI